MKCLFFVTRYQLLFLCCSTLLLVACKSNAPRKPVKPEAAQQLNRKEPPSALQEREPSAVSSPEEKRASSNASNIKPDAVENNVAEPAVVEQMQVSSGTLFKMDKDFVSVKRIVPFAFGSGRLGPEGRQSVEQLIPAALMADRIHIRGNTDAKGNSAQNISIAVGRAVSVKAVFAAAGVQSTKFKLTYCTRCYAASNATEEGRKKNRRVDVDIILPRDKLALVPVEREQISGLHLTQVSSLESSRH